MSGTMKEILKVDFTSSMESGVSDFPYYYTDYEKLNITKAILEFYLIEDLILNFPTNVFLMERKKFSNLFISLILLRKELNEKFARVLFDYLCASSLGEARHATQRPHGFFIENYDAGFSRNSVYSDAHIYSPAKFLPILLKVFETGNWGNGYGGAKWARIVQAAMLYEKVSNQVFIDHIIDLAHNGGTAFDKNYLVHLDNRDHFKYILDTKFKKNGMSTLVLSINQKIPDCSITPQLKLLAVDIGSRIYDKKVLESLTLISAKELAFPPPIPWGKGNLICECKKKDEIIFRKKCFNFEEQEEKDLFFSNMIFYKQEIRHNILTIIKHYEKLSMFSPNATQNFCSEAQKKLDEYKIFRKKMMKEKKLLKQATSKQMTILDKILEDDDVPIKKDISAIDYTKVVPSIKPAIPELNQENEEQKGEINVRVP